MPAAHRYWYTIATTTLLACAQPISTSPPRAPVAASSDAPVRAPAVVSPVAAAVAVAAEPVAVVRGPTWPVRPQGQPSAGRDCPKGAAPALGVTAARRERAAVTIGGAFEPGCPHTLGADLGAYERAPGGFPAPASELMSIFRVDW